MSSFQKGASYSGIRIFNNLPRSITSLRNEKPQFKVALKKSYVYTSFTLWMNFLRVQMICITDLYACVNSYTVIILYILYAFDTFHILSSGDSLRDLWNVYTVCIYVC